jgi:hypothetical protein
MQSGQQEGKREGGKQMHQGTEAKQQEEHFDQGDGFGHISDTYYREDPLPVPFNTPQYAQQQRTQQQRRYGRDAADAVDTWWTRPFQRQPLPVPTNATEMPHSAGLPIENTAAGVTAGVAAGVTGAAVEEKAAVVETAAVAAASASAATLAAAAVEESDEETADWEVEADWEAAEEAAEAAEAAAAEAAEAAKAKAKAAEAEGKDEEEATLTYSYRPTALPVPPACNWERASAREQS